MAWQSGDPLEDYELPEKCECDDPYHGVEGCNNSPAKYDGVICSPALCMRCLFSCEL